ncbi:MAG: hypothetical protein GEU90_16285 [Gemmatimonas sp.]|nr:hypothetical protein [Gemmatimonas sp.]
MVSMKWMTAVVAAVTTTAACGGEQGPGDGGEGAVAEAPAPTDGMQDMPGMSDTDSMPGMADMQSMGGMMSAGMMEEMQTHMQAMMGADADSMMAMMPSHRQMVANLIAQSNREMREMNMPADPEWNATVDSLRQDLRGMPEMSVPELMALMPEHHERVQRLMEMHQGMMGSM